jgi:uridine kinase
MVRPANADGHAGRARAACSAPSSGAAPTRAVPSSGRRLLELVVETRRRLGRTTIVGISGIDCAGKSTLARRLADELGDAGEDVVVIGGDDFNRPRAERSTYPADEPDYGFAYGQLVEELLVPARVGGRVEARLRVKDWRRDAWDERTFIVDPGAIVLFEGVFLFTSAILPLLDLKVWLEIPFDRALERALVRDAEAMGGENGVRERYATRYFPGQRLHLERDRPKDRADVVVSGGAPTPPSRARPSSRSR